MNQVLKLRNCSHLFKKLGGSAFKVYCNDISPFASFFILYNRPQIDLPFPAYSFYQVRKFAKKAQGKLMKSGKAKTLQLSDEEMADVINVVYYREELHLIVDKLKKDYVEYLSVHSAVGNIDKIMVKIDDEEYPLNELAMISKKNPNLIVINMTDFPDGLKPTIQALLDSGSGLNPQQEGTMIYLNVPKLTREHREMLAKNAKSMFMKAKEEVRSVQNSFVKEAKGKTELSEDLVFSATNQIRTMAEHCVSEMEMIMKHKQKELIGVS